MLRCLSSQEKETLHSKEVKLLKELNVRINPRLKVEVPSAHLLLFADVFSVVTLSVQKDSKAQKTICCLITSWTDHQLL